MAPGISYDDSGSLASYFGVTFLVVVLLPSTYLILRPSTKDQLQPLTPNLWTPHAKSIQSKTQSKRQRKNLRLTIPLALGWAVLAFLCYTLAKAPRIEGEALYDPFEILGLSSSSSEKQIKKHYKKLSLQFHPDKLRPSPNQTKESLESHFVDLTKAYKSLTDEVTRENLAKYGNPDGPQQREDKIAIPQWVVEGRNNVWVLGVYGLGLGGGIPFVVGRWWFSQRRLTRDGILNATAEQFFHNLRDDTDFPTLITILAMSLEFVPLLSGKKKSKKERKDRQARVEELEKEIEERRELWGEEEGVWMRKDSRVVVPGGAARRARALLWGHLLRIDLVDQDLKDEQAEVLQLVPKLLNALLNITLSHNWLKTTLLVLKLQPSLVQALPANASPLAQLPGINPEKGAEIEIVDGAEGKRWLEKFIKKQQGREEYKQAVEVGKWWPRLEITDAEFRVTGEKLVTPGSIVQLAFKARYVFPTPRESLASSPTTAKAIANGDASDSVDGEKEVEGSVADVEDSLEPITKASNGFDVDVKEKIEEVKDIILDKVEDVKEKVDGVVEKVEKKVGRKGKAVEVKTDWKSNGFAYTPHWPFLRKPHYQVLLGDTKLDRVIVPPIRITDIPLPSPVTLLPSEPREFTLQFQAPPQANLYSFVLFAGSDTFLGSDVDKPIMMKVEDPPEDESYSSDGDISDPEEDSLAGQMAMMRGGKVKPSPIHGERGAESDGESGSESEYESSSDEDTPAGGKGKKNVPLKRKVGGRVRAINENSSDSE